MPSTVGFDSGSFVVLLIHRTMLCGCFWKDENVVFFQFASLVQLPLHALTSKFDSASNPFRCAFVCEPPQCGGYIVQTPKNARLNTKST